MKNWKFEPAVYKTAITGVVALLAIWGYNASEWGDKLTQSVDVLALLIPAVIALVANVVSGLWVRKSVTPVEAVVEQVNKHGEVVAGPANDILTEGVVVRNTGDDVPLEGYKSRHLDV